MKNHRFALAASTIALSLILELSAADSASPRPQDGAPPSAQERLEKMAERLSLTPEQREKIKAIMEKAGPEIRAIMEKGRQNVSETDRSKVRELLKSQTTEIASVLTPEQREKFKETREQRASPPAIDERLNRMTSSLSLSSEQQAKVKSIMESHAPEFRELMAKGRDKSTDADKERFRELMKKQFVEIAAVLTPEQQSKFKELRDDRERAGRK